MKYLISAKKQRQPPAGGVVRGILVRNNASPRDSLHGPVPDTAVKLVVRIELTDAPFILARDWEHGQLTHRTFEIPNQEYPMFFSLGQGKFEDNSNSHDLHGYSWPWLAFRNLSV